MHESVAGVNAVLGQTIAPAWLVVPLAAFTLVVLAGHWIALGRAALPAFVKRVRSVNGLLMMLSVPVLAYAFGLADVNQARQFVLSWMLATGLLTLVLMLAFIDLLHTLIASRRQMRALRQEAARLRAKALAEQSRAGAAGRADTSDA